ncbi:hypothetical protein HDC37_003079 [Microbacterium sp. AK009]|uniref:hypothetical protein n=1 Tax=Microbacterium sp. AK009 TaxID=2723068 RepID=UPI0015C7F6EF|nr:hypothetical protein [Microbacterium sp. AK009]NYF18223.1 hypothetical protein [Microbacterium sp. AK009]
MTEACETCDPVVVRNNGRPPHDVDVVRTTDALIRRVESGRMRYLGGDVPLEDMVALAKSDLKCTIVSYLTCGECRRTWFWGLCIRGAPIYKPVAPDAPALHPWSAVPPREQWAGEPRSE